MKNQDALLLLALLWLVGRSAGGSSSSPNPAPSQTYPSGTDERWLVDGVYWWCASASEAQPLLTWFSDNTDKVRLVKMLGTNGGDCAVVLFEVRERIQWTLGGTPEEAPRGLDTTLDDLRSESKMHEFFRKMGERTLEQIRSFDARVQQWMDSVMPHRPW